MIIWWCKHDIQTAGAVRSSSSDDKLKCDYLIKTDSTVVQKKVIMKYSSNSATKKTQLKW